MPTNREVQSYAFLGQARPSPDRRMTIRLPNNSLYPSQIRKQNERRTQCPQIDSPVGGPAMARGLIGTHLGRVCSEQISQ